MLTRQLMTTTTTTTKSITRFRCGQCGNRLVMQNRHLRRLVACHACGRATHPIARRLIAAQPKPPVAKAPAAATSPPPVAAAPPRTPTLELSAAPLIPLAMLGVTSAAFFAALSVMSYLGGFLTAVLLVGAAGVGVRWVRRGTTSVRARLEQIDALRLRYSILHVTRMIFTWLWTQPRRRKPAACLLVMLWASLYTPYCLTRGLLPAPSRPRSIPARRP